MENNDTSQDVQITFTRYRDQDGNPTCGKDFRSGEFCPFLMTSGFGTREHCFWEEGRGMYRPVIERRMDGRGTTIPGKNCPLWPCEGG